MRSLEKQAMRNERGQCIGKVTYSSAAEARRSAARRSFGNRERGKVEPYRCPHCGLIHLGHGKPTR